MGIVNESGKSLIPATIALFILAWFAPPATAGNTLEQIKARGTLHCGVNQAKPGFSTKDASGQWSGMEVDFCRAVAAAVFGDPKKVTFVPLRASERFPALKSSVVDLLARATAWTLSREASLKLRFPGILFYDAQALMVPAADGIKSVAQLNGATICVEKGTTHERNLTDHFTAQGLKVKPLVIDSPTEVADAFFSGRCKAYTSDISDLAGARLRAPAGQTFDILPEHLSKEPLGPVVRSGDDEWLTLVRWVLFALIAAEENGITRDNIREIRETTKHPAARRALGVEGGFGPMLGTDQDWALHVVESVGNYGEMFERNLGVHSPLHLERGLNRLWTHGGLMYAPPVR
jgi:general L-amino acid transport system substrate-binding protein